MTGVQTCALPIYRKMKYVNGQVMVAAVPENIDRLLKMSGVYSFVSKYDSVIEAVNRVNKKEGA